MKKKSTFLFYFLLLIAGFVLPVYSTYASKLTTELRLPAVGVLCDRYICVNHAGVSHALTKKYLGKKVANKLLAEISQVQGHFDRTKFTFANGIFCDTKKRLCYKNRYYVNGKHSPVSMRYTRLLFRY